MYFIVFVTCILLYLLFHLYHDIISHINIPVHRIPEKKNNSRHGSHVTDDMWYTITRLCKMAVSGN